MPEHVYALAQIRVEDEERYFTEYVLPTFRLLKKNGCEILVGSFEAEQFEGEKIGNWTVVVRFPSAEQAKAFYASAEYANLKKARIGDLSDGGNVLLVPSFDPAVLDEN